MSVEIRALIEGMIFFEENSGSDSLAVKLRELCNRIEKTPMLALTDFSDIGQEIANIYFEDTIERLCRGCEDED